MLANFNRFEFIVMSVVKMDMTIYTYSCFIDDDRRVLILEGESFGYD